jgi:tetratricopeptide (TPR) repeat protein
MAPLAAGGVHRASMILLMTASALGLGLLLVGSAAEGRPLRTGLSVVLPMILLAIPLVQSLPLSVGLRGFLDPNGNSLLAENDLSSPRFWPLSLDPPMTREHIGTAAAALAAFLVAFHLASGKSMRHLLPRLVALVGVAAVAIGLGHRLFSVTEVYGLFKTGNNQSLLTGPFVNRNHTAELLELATFSSLACSFQRNDALNRYGWLAAMLLCAVGALGTLSRGALVGGFVGMLVFGVLRYFSDDGGAPVLKRKVALAWAVLAPLSVVAMAAILGAGAVIDRFRTTPVSQDLRFELWRDSLRVLVAHPLGIGRGAFERVYPAYRTFRTSTPVTFAFVENHPLQLLIDSGWPLFGAILVGVALVVRQLVLRGRRDKIEAALLAGLFAVGAHSTLDFGLETLGVSLPFMTILGTVLGRLRVSQEVPARRKVAWSLVGATCASLVLGAVAIAHPSDDDFDKLLEPVSGPEQVRAILRRAQIVHPTDYFYALDYARTEPLRVAGAVRSPRLHALNRALRLCPNCELVHAEIARSLWHLGSHGQALTEWRSAVQIQPLLFPKVLLELAREGAKPQELAAVGAFDARKMVEVSDFLASDGQVKDAVAVLDQADVMGAPRTESLLSRAKLQLQLHQLDDVRTTLAQAHAAGIQDSRLALLDAQLILASKGDAGADEALAVLDLAATRDPLDLPVQRMRISMVSGYRKWSATDRAIDGLKLALYHVSGSAVEANLAAARIHAQLSQWSAAIGEYRIALAQMPAQPSVWIELGQAAERAGRETVARDAYREAARLSPAGPATDALRQLDARRDEMKKADLQRGAMGEELETP